MAEREFAETVDTAEEGVTFVSKVGGRVCAAAGVVTLGGRGGMKSRGGFHGSGGLNDVVHRSVGSMVVGVNVYWERMSGSEMTAAIRDVFCCWRREFAIRIIYFLTPI